MSTKSEHDRQPKDADAKSAAAPVQLPHCAYFYYLEPTSQTHAEVTAFIIDLKGGVPDNKIDTLVPAWVKQAQDETYTDIIPIGWRFSDVRWCRLSYVVMVADHNMFKLADVEIVYDNAAATHTLKKAPVTGLAKPLSGIRFLNEIMKKHGGKWDKHSKYNEPFDIKLMLALWTGGASLNALTHDSTGTNMGPPLPPP